MMATGNRVNPDVALARHLRALATAWRRHARLRWGLRALAAAMCLDAALLLGFRLSLFDVSPLWLGAVPVSFLTATTLLASVRQPNERYLALRADRALHLQERLTTAVELRESRADHVFAALQLADALAQMDRHKPTDVFPLRVPGRELALLVAGAAGAALLVALPVSDSHAAASKPQPQAVIKQEAERVTALANEVASQTDGTDPATRAAVAQALRESGAALTKQTGTPEQAATTLSDAAQKVSALQDAQAEALRQALARAAQGLQTDSATRAAGDSLAQGDAASAADAVRRLGANAAGMSPAQRASAAQALRSAASSAGRFDAALGDSLAKAGDALSGGDSQAAEAAAQAASAVQEAGQQVARQDLVEKALSQLARSQAAIGSAAPSAGSPGASSAGERVEAPRQQEQGSDSGGKAAGLTQSGPPAGNSDQGGGQNAASGQQAISSADVGQGQPAGGAGTGTAANSSDGFDGSKLRSRLEQVASAGFDQPSVSASNRSGQPDAGQALAGYSDVYADYRDRATAAVQDRYIPLNLKELVKDYFTALDPTH